MSEVASGHWEPTATGRQTRPDPTDKVTKFLDSLGLKCHLVEEDWALRAIVGLKQSDVDKVQRTTDASEIGVLFGYPATAVQAFAAEESLDGDEQDRLCTKEGIPPNFSPFRLSKRFWEQELKVIVEWFRLLEQYELTDSSPDTN